MSEKEKISEMTVKTGSSMLSPHTRRGGVRFWLPATVLALEFLVVLGASHCVDERINHPPVIIIGSEQGYI